MRHLVARLRVVTTPAHRRGRDRTGRSGEMACSIARALDVIGEPVTIGGRSGIT